MSDVVLILRARSAGPHVRFRPGFGHSTCVHLCSLLEVSCRCRAERAARDGSDAEGTIEGGDCEEHTFETTGTNEYFCIPHEGSGMTGTITVE